MVMRIAHSCPVTAAYVPGSWRRFSSYATSDRPLRRLFGVVDGVRLKRLLRREVAGRRVAVG
jgi:hypothetical protein